MFMSKKIIIGNWKMNPSSLMQAEDLFKSIQKNIFSKIKTDIIICPPNIYLPSFAKTLAGKEKLKKIFLGAQNVSYEEKGAYTGEISVEMLKDIGVKYVIIGHSERRSPPTGGGENNSDINKKIKMVLSFNLIPILCIGEKERDKSHEYLNFIKKQIEECLKNVAKSFISKIIIAYEPIWAIGKASVREASPEEFREMSIFIRKILSDKFGAKSIKKIKIIYGGSVNSRNVSDFLKEGGADGFLVGRNSLDPKKFGEIIEVCEA